MINYTNKEIEEMFNNRFVINATSYNSHTFAPVFSFRDKKNNKFYTFSSNVSDYAQFKIDMLRSIVEEERDEKIKIILE